MPGASTGSWFPSGYHGHYYGKFRNDFLQEYRMQARPHPPDVFIQRLRENPRKHIFSAHDNRHCFPSTTMSFESGLGKRKVKKPSGPKPDFVPCLVSWASLQNDEKYPRPMISTYQSAYWHPKDSSTIPQVLNPWAIPHDSTSHSFITTYRHAFSHKQPNMNVNTNVLTGQVVDEPLAKEDTFMYVDGRHQRPLPPRSRRSQSALYHHITVSDCLTWDIPKEREAEVSEKV
ncbi:uncharacterized protein C3orf84 homolog [Protopterus annectens]|uniref:uncharacterized protein C3orf84 homolog n=1 Tax=Protopterus annectens TaxID=7888 RepID=UPI001CF947DB|nr:uncharacterized protein C3orf84 homolog [Protopterus annectens]